MKKSRKFALIIGLTAVLIILSVSILIIATQKPKLEKPANLAITNGVLTWNTVENAESYLVDIDGIRHQATTNSYSLVALTAEKTYTVKVIAVAETNSKYSNSDPSDPIQHTVGSSGSLSDIYTDLENGTISADEYITQLIYAQFDSSRLNEKYKSTFDGFATGIHLEDEILELIDELSDSVLQYYFETVNLSNVTFNYEGSQLSSPRAATTTTSSGAGVNLGNAVLSSNGRFVVWYAKTGTNAITDNVAQSIAAKLESTTIFYQDFFGKSYQYNSNDAAFGTGSKRNTMKSTLTSLGIDANYLDDAMQVYIVNYSGAGLAYYSEMGGLLKNSITGIAGMYADAMVAFPHIVIGADSVKDGLNADLEQIINHEFFHHWQTFLKEGDRNLFMSDATANWAAANASDYGNTDGTFNGHAAWMDGATSAAFETENFKKNFSYFRYSFFTYLDAYEKNVSDGRQKIIDALYITDISIFDGMVNSVVKNHKNVALAYQVFDYLEANATREEMENVMSYLAQRTLQQDYENKNFTAGGTGADVVTPFELGWAQGLASYNFESTAKGAMLYYKITESEKFTVDISIGTASSNLNAIVISQKGLTFSLVDIYTANIKFDYEPVSGETLWVIVVNTSLTEYNKPHAISVEQTIPDWESVNGDLRDAILTTLAEFSKFPDTNMAISYVSDSINVTIAGNLMLIGDTYYYLDNNGYFWQWHAGSETWYRYGNTYSNWKDLFQSLTWTSFTKLDYTIYLLEYILEAADNFSSVYDADLGCDVWYLSEYSVEYDYLRGEKLVIENGRISMMLSYSKITVLTYGGQVII